MDRVDFSAFEGADLTPQKVILNEKGNIFHALKASDTSFSEFGEAYFSCVNEGVTKGWKQHAKMIMNIVVPVGSVRFYLVDHLEKQYTCVDLNKENYVRITVRPGIWMAFEGLANNNLILNVASIEHDPTEAVNQPLEYFNLAELQR